MRKKIADLRKGELPLSKFYEPYHSVLRTKCGHTKLAFNKSAFDYLERMKETASAYKIVYLASNQVFSRDSMFVIRKDYSENRWIHESYKDAKGYKGYINPQINEKLGQKVDVWERCMSMPYIECRASRNTELKVSYVNQKRQNIKEQVVGFRAFVFQHCMDHLNGKIAFDWNICRGFMRVYPQTQDLFPKTKLMLRDYSLKIREAINKRKNIEQQIVLSEEQKQLQTRQEDVIRKVVEEEINKYVEKYSPK